MAGKLKGCSGFKKSGQLSMTTSPNENQQMATSHDQLILRENKAAFL
jgi:hypothetical protein